MIQAQLTKIFASEGFIRSPRMRRFLEFVTEETLAGRSDQLGEYSIGVSVFDRGSGFEPGLDPIVRNDARRLRAKLLEYYGREGASDPVIIDIPKGAYVPVFLSPTSTGRSSISTHRVGVLPFESFSQEGASCGHALCMALTMHLTNLNGIETVSHRYLREQASETRLTHAVHGSVMSSGGRYHVIINLVHVSDGTQLWARQYDFAAGDLFAVQSQIASHLCRELAARVGPRKSQPSLMALAA